MSQNYNLIEIEVKVTYKCALLHMVNIVYYLALGAT